jgi:hypothetical protein
MQTSIKAVISTGYGTSNVLEVKEIPKPQVDKNSLLIRHHACNKPSRLPYATRYSNDWLIIARLNKA